MSFLMNSGILDLRPNGPRSLFRFFKLLFIFTRLFGLYSSSVTDIVIKWTKYSNLGPPEWITWMLTSQKCNGAVQFTVLLQRILQMTRGRIARKCFIPLTPSPGTKAPSGPGPLHYRGFTITVGRTPLDGWSVRRRNLYLTTHNNLKRQTSMPPAGFGSANPTSVGPQTQTCDPAATGIGTAPSLRFPISSTCNSSIKTLLQVQK